MKTMKVTFIIAVSFVIFMGTGAEMGLAGGSGGGGEPGGVNCEGGKYKMGEGQTDPIYFWYATQIYKGEIKAVWQPDNTVWISGRVDRVPDKKGTVCYAEIKEPIRYQTNVLYVEFQNTKAENFIGHCMKLDFWNSAHPNEDLFKFSGDCFQDSVYFEVVDIENIKIDNWTLTADISVQGMYAAPQSQN